jgi:iron complex transport system substrate-binding protein
VNFVIKKRKKTDMKYRKILFAALLGAILTACHSTQKQDDTHTDTTAALADSLDALKIRYAKGFQLRQADNGWLLLDICDPEGRETQSFHFALTAKSESTANPPEGYTPLQLPLEKVVCMTSLQLSNFIRLNQLDKVVGITSTRHLFNPVMKERLRTGATRKIGIEGNFDHEVIMALQPEVILVSPFKRGGYEAMRETGIPLLPHLGYKEPHPLGQAEWMKLTGLLTGHLTEANKAFDQIEKHYLTLTELAAKADTHPTVFSGEIQGGNWYAVGGQSFLAHIFRDAGADYFLKDNPETGGVTLDFEVVYNQAAQADYWRIVNSYDGEFSYEALAAEDARYRDFKAFRQHGVAYCNMKQTPFYESMPVEPDWVLADFIHIFHPDLLPDYQPHYYHLLP